MTHAAPPSRSVRCRYNAKGEVVEPIDELSARAKAAIADVQRSWNEFRWGVPRQLGALLTEAPERLQKLAESVASREDVDEEPAPEEGALPVLMVYDDGMGDDEAKHVAVGPDPSRARR